MSFMKAQRVRLRAEHLKPFSGQRVVMRVVDNGEPYLGKGRVSLGKGCLLLHFEWFVRVRPSSEGCDDFEKKRTVSIPESFHKKEYEMECRHPELILHQNGWLTAAGEGMKVMISAETANMAIAQAIRKNLQEIIGLR